jgi:hypothetical protein
MDPNASQRTPIEEAADPATSPSRLRELARKFGRGVAGNPNAPTDLLLKLAGRYFEAFVANPVLPLLLLEDPGFCARIPGKTLRRLLRRADVPEMFLRTLERHADSEVREGARWHVATCSPEFDPAQVVRDSVAEMTSPREPLRELFDLGAVPPWLVEPLAGSNDAELRDLAVQSLSGKDDQAAKELEQLYRRAGAMMPRRGGGAVGPAGDLRAEEMERLARGGVWARQLAARHRATPPETLSRLARERTLPIRCAALRHPFIAEEALWSAAGSARDVVRLAVARNPRAPAGVLDRLAKDSSPAVRRAVVQHRRAEMNALRSLAADSDKDVRLAVARHPACPADVLASLAGAPEEKIRQAVAEHRQTPAESVARLATDPSEWVRRNVAKRYDLTEELRLVLVCDPEISVRHGIMFNPRSPREVWDEMRHIGRDPEAARQVLARWPLRPMKPKPVKERPERFRFPLPRRRFLERDGMRSALELHPIALDRSTTPDDLDRLAEENDRWVLEAVGGNPNTRPETLKRLLRHPARTWHLYFQILGNPNVPLDTLESFVTHQNVEARQYVAWSKSASPEILLRLASDQDEKVRNAVAYHKKAPAEALALLAGDSSGKIRISVLGNPATPWSVIEGLLPQTEGNLELRKALARNPALPPEWRAQLARDPEIGVRLALAENERLSVEDYVVLSKDPEATVRNAARSVYRWSDELFFAQAQAARDEETLSLFASNEKTPGELLEELAAHPNPKIRVSVAHNKKSPASAIAKLAQDADDGVRKTVLAHPACPPSLIDKILDEGVPPSPDIYGFLASPVLTEEHFRRMLRGADKDLRRTLACSEHTPISILREIINAAEKGDWVTLSGKRKLPPDLLDEIVRSASPQIRNAVASHFHTPREVAERIALSGDPQDYFERRTRAEVARRRDSSVSCLSQMLDQEIALAPRKRFRWRRRKYEDEYNVLAELIGRTELPIERFEKLISRDEQHVRRALLARKDLPVEWRARMLREALARNLKRSGTARLAALAHPAAPAESLALVVAKGTWLERYAVTQNPQAPRTLLQPLATDSHAVVRRAAEAALTQESAQ